MSCKCNIEMMFLFLVTSVRYLLQSWINSNYTNVDYWTSGTVIYVVLNNRACNIFKHQLYSIYNNSIYIIAFCAVACVNYL